MPAWPRYGRRAHAAVAAILALAASILIATGHLDGRASVLDRIESPLLDLRFLLVGPESAPGHIVIVALDDEAIREAGAYPLPRATLARLVRALAGTRPRAIGLDLLLLDRGPDAADADLAAALRESGAVLAAAAAFRGGAPGGAEAVPIPGLPVAERLRWPIERFREGTGIGLVNIATDHAGTPRHVPLLIRHGDTALPSFPLRLAAQAARAEPVLEAGRIAVGAARSRPDLGLNLPLRFYGPRGTIRTVSAGAVLRGDVEAEELRDRIVIVGATAFGAADTFAMPYDPVLPGVEVLATAVGHLSTGDGLVRDAVVRRIDAGAAILLAVAAALLVSLAPAGPALAVVILAALAWLVATVIAFGAHLWLSAAMPLAAMIPGLLYGLLGRLGLDRRRARELARSESALSLFHPPALAARLARDPGFLAAPVTQEVGIVFVDLSGFTRLSERLGSQETELFLRAYHGVVEAQISRHGGVVLSFMGDGALAVFGLLDPGPDDARQALRAADGLVTQIRSWLAAHRATRGRPVDLRVGAHHGEVVASRLGAADHQQIAVAGDSVNVASRLMEVAKDLGAALVVSTDLLAASGVAAAEMPFEGERAVAIRGRAEPLRVAYRWGGTGPAH
ncbi:CHASE2 domain-containing protein [Methylobacterium soli]|uniref:Adenylate/guanylate cyclase domain-containing protein n=1 Tax=Methylobacterium soli TaxID=553447 RepID=A0A6L3T6G1_9HYPH|nr:adenylate/guanylate cyclase domain-containing protein [Methylobacterium soli]KAB1080714.1 adenylate/guanylate cyclase domain-containing protein [Methylobacterium soli]GJE42400.1 hypothetical protein AEGHOMDF_1572 [Methylobacterium soli]